MIFYITAIIKKSHLYQLFGNYYKKSLESSNLAYNKGVQKKTEADQQSLNQLQRFKDYWFQQSFLNCIKKQKQTQKKQNNIIDGYSSYYFDTRAR